MISTKVGWDGGRLNTQSLQPSAFQMQRLMQVGLQSVRGRVARGIGSDDAAMPPLKPGYAKAKARKGGAPFRNLQLSGEMLANLSIRSVSEEEAKAAFTTRSARTKADANEKRAPWLGWAQSDVTAILREAQKYFGAAVSTALKGVRGVRKAA